MDRLLNAFTDHPHSVGESYFAHMGTASRFAATMAVGAIACFIHGLLPFLFVTTGSRQIRRLNDAMVTHRRDARARLDAKAPPGEGAADPAWCWTI